MELTVLERIILQELLPKESNYITFKILTDLRAELSFTEAEIKNYGINQEGGRVTWNSAKAQSKKVAIGETAMNIIVDALKKLDENNKINGDNIGLYEKFIKTQ